MNLTPEETAQFIELLRKAAPRDQLAGGYTVIVTPTTFSHEDFIPRKQVCVGDVSNVVGEINCEVAMDARALANRVLVL